MIKIQLCLSLRRCHTSLCTFCNNLFPSSSFCSKELQQPSLPSLGVPLLFCGSLFSLTPYHSYFLIILDSVSYLTWIITMTKNQKLFLTNNYQLVISVKWKCIFLNETHAFGTRYRQICWNYMANLHKKIGVEV